MMCIKFKAEKVQYQKWISAKDRVNSKIIFSKMVGDSALNSKLFDKAYKDLYLYQGI